MPRTNSAVLGFHPPGGRSAPPQSCFLFFPGRAFFGSSAALPPFGNPRSGGILPGQGVWASSCGSSQRASPLAGFFLHRGSFGRRAFCGAAAAELRSVHAGTTGCFPVRARPPAACRPKPVVCGAGAGCGCTVSFGVMTGSPTVSASRRGE